MAWSILISVLYVMLWHVSSLQKHYNQLREEFAKVKAPEGLEDFEKGDIDPKEKQYETEQSASSSTSNKDTHQIVPADSNANSMVPTQNEWISLPFCQH